MKQELYNVEAVNIETGAVRLIAENKTLRNAEAIVTMCVMRLGVEEEFFREVPIPELRGHESRDR